MNWVTLIVLAPICTAGMMLGTLMAGTTGGGVITGGHVGGGSGTQIAIDVTGESDNSIATVNGKNRYLCFIAVVCLMH